MANNIYQYNDKLAFISSTDVKVFPCAYRGYDRRIVEGGGEAPAGEIWTDYSKIFDPEARGFTEYNYSNIYSKLGDTKQSFVISWKDGVLKCVIGGYYFELSNMSVEDFADNKKLVISTKRVDLGSMVIGHRYKTWILDTLSDESVDYLDLLLGDDDNPYAYYFVGLGLAAEDYESTNYSASLTPFKIDTNGDLVIDWAQRRVTDTIDTGTGISSIRMIGNVSGTSSDECDASGDYTAAFGKLTTASGEYSVALGYNTTASGEAAIAIGNSTKSKHKNAIATGSHTTTSTDNQVVIGKYNKDDANALVIIAGEGTSTSNKINNVTIHKNGDIWTTGKLSVDGGEIKATTKEINKLQLGGNTQVLGSGEIHVYGSAASEVFTVSNTGATTIESTLNVSGNTTTTGTLKTKGTITSSGGTNNTLTLGSSASGDYGALTIYGTSTSNSGIFTVSNAGAVYAASTLNVKGATTLDNILTVADGKSTTLGGDLTTKGNTDLKGALNADGTTTLKSTLEVTGAATLKSTLGVTGATTLSGTLAVTGNTTIAGTLTVNEATTLKKAVTVKNDITGEGKLTIDGSTELKSTLQVTNAATLKNNLIVDGATTLNNGLTVANSKTTDLTGALSVTGETTLKGGLTVAESKDTSLTGGLAVTGATTFGSTVDITGALTLSAGLTATTITGSGAWSTSGTMTASSYTATSDKRLKENIKEFEYKKSILDLPIYKFDFIDGPKNQIGCLAQDLQEFYPELVQENEAGFLSIQESKLVYLLLEEVKKLREELKQVKEN